MVKEIVDNLRAIRVANKISQEELARATGVSQKHISNIENHKDTPTIETLQKLARGLGVEISLKLLDKNHIEADALPRN
ncbi:helix-turn-helix domain-containing protein [Desulfofundulus thermobenzoicus]|uniref:Helix-turn-helix domain-containing protein n=1 Tax=Desulfofundulus thermobenzoicus TaxID=29376 RepID=A0A6N7IWU2_9FIRM|nr:helix-turn-helix transcriptional regulator [Desulfofundulus thermobenzoicus]MQL53628.1 helix-turn-helix domain-containing protein [Desulfofundulus thermobenzoicus]